MPVNVGSPFGSPDVVSNANVTKPDATLPVEPARRCSRLPRPVDVRTVLDGHDVDPTAIIIDAVNHPVVPTAGAVQPLQPKLERLTDTVRAGRQGPVQELHDRDGHLLRQARQRAAGAARPGDRVTRFAHRPGIRRSASSLLSTGSSALASSARLSRMSPSSASLPITSRVSSKDSRSSTLMTTAAGWPCLVITTRPCSRSSLSTTSDRRFFTSARDICSPTDMAISIATFAGRWSCLPGVLCDHAACPQVTARLRGEGRQLRYRGADADSVPQPSASTDSNIHDPDGV